MDLQTLAAEVRKMFVCKKRDNGASFWSIPGDKPKWITDLCREAHGDMMPDDYKYEYIVEALDRLKDGDEDGDEIEPDVYNSDLSKWMGSHSDRGWYVDEAVKEFGHSEDGIYADMMMGQVQEKREVFYSVKQSLESHLEDLEVGADAKDIMDLVKEEKENQ